MKKFVVLSLISFLVLAFGATVYGQEKAPTLEFKASGFFDVISEYSRNVPQPGASTASGTVATSRNNVMFGPPPDPYLPYGEIKAKAASSTVITNTPAKGDQIIYGNGSPSESLYTNGEYIVYRPGTAAVNGEGAAFNKRSAWMESRGRLKFDALMGKDMSGTFQFEIDSTRWGERAPSGAQRNYAGHWGVADRAAIEVKHMYFTFGVPWIPVPTVIQAGIQPFAIRPGVFFVTDAPGITASVKADPATIKFFWAKPQENLDWASDDQDVYALEVSARVQAITLGIYGMWFNSNTYPIGSGTSAAAFPTAVSVDGGAPLYSAEFYWAGLYADGKIGPLNLNFDFVYDNGKVKDRTPAATAKDVKYQGFGGVLNIGFPWEKFLFGFATIYGSGADQEKTSRYGIPGDTVANGTAKSTKVGTYVIPSGSEGSVGYSLVMNGAGINRMNSGFEPATDSHARAGFGGMWINKLYAGFQVSPEFGMRIEGMYITDTTKNGNTIGTATKSNGLPRNDSEIGWELDWFNTLQIYKNLAFQFGFGVLWAGSAMDYYNGANGNNRGPNTPFVVTSNLTYNF